MGWWGVIGIIWTAIIVGTGIWFWYLHHKGELIAEYPYDDEM